jgi:hypothetical protein
MDFNQVMWGNKKFSDLLKDIYINSKSKENQIKGLIATLTPFVHDAQSAVIIIPLIAEHLNISVKNDEQLIKLAAIVQRATASTSNNDSNNEYSLSEAEKEQLFNIVQEIGDGVKGVQKENK